MRGLALALVALVGISCISASTISLPIHGNTRLAAMAKNPFLTRAFEKEIREFVGCIQEVLKTGLPEHGLPSFDPLDLPELEIDLDSLNNPQLAGKLSLKNVHLAGVVGWDITTLKVTVHLLPIGATVDVTLTWPEVSGSVEYSGDITVGDKNVFGTGTADFDVTNFEVSVNTKVNISPINIKKLSILPSIGSLRASITGLYNDEELSQQLSESISQNAAQWLNDNAAAIDEQLSAYIMDTVNNAEPGEPGEPGGEENIINIIIAQCQK